MGLRTPGVLWTGVYARGGGLGQPLPCVGIRWSKNQFAGWLSKIPNMYFSKMIYIQFVDFSTRIDDGPVEMMHHGWYGLLACHLVMGASLWCGTHCVISCVQRLTAGDRVTAVVVKFTCL